MLDAANAKLRKPDLACETIADYDTKTLASVNSFILHTSGSNTSGGSISAAIVYYPVYGKNRCLSDGNEPSWLGSDAKFDNAEACCAENFGWVEESCLANSPAMAPPVVEEYVEEVISEEINISVLYYPAQNGYICVNDGLQPSWMSVAEMFSKESDCCERHYPDRDCLGKSGELKPKMWYPSTEGVMCVSDRKQPSWMSLDSMFETEAECCAFHYGWKHDCSSDSQPTMYQNSVEVVTLTPEPTNHPTRHSTPNPTFKKEPIVTPRPTRRPQSDSPSRHPSRQPSRRPTRTPTRPPVSPAIPANNMASQFATFQTPTAKPAMPPIGSSYFGFYFKPASGGGDQPTSQAIAMNAPTHSTLSARPLNKGEESHMGDIIESQIKGTKKKQKKKKKKKGWKKKLKKKMKQLKWKNNR